MKNGNNCNFIGRLVDLINNNVWQADYHPLVGARHATDMAHVRQQSQAICGVPNARHYFGCSAWIVLVDVFVNVFDRSVRAVDIELS